jgi:N-acetylglucosamine kinase
MAACFDIGGSYIKFGSSDADGAVSEAGRLPTPVHSFAEFILALKSAIAPEQSGGPISISLAGIFDRANGMATIANVPCLNGRRVGQDLTAALGAPVHVTNDADCFALAEAHSGAGKGKSNVFGVILGTGVGGGVVIEGKLLRGFGGISGEWGHGPITDPAAGGLCYEMPRQRCGCGRTDCLDPSGSARGLENVHAAQTGETLDSKTITALWKSGDRTCENTVTIFVEQIARPLSVIVNTLGCDIVPVSGGLASEPGLIARIDAKVRQYVLAHYPDPLVVPGLHGAEGGLKGAAIVAHQAVAA